MAGVPRPLLAFGHRWDEVIEQVGHVLRLRWEGAGNAFWEDLCPALARAAAETGGWKAASRAVEGSVDPNLRRQHRQLGGRLLKAMRKRGGIEARFPDSANAAFASEVAHARNAALGDADEAWRILVAAVPSWVSFRLDQVTPTALLADPALGPLLTPGRCRELLATPRGTARVG